MDGENTTLAREYYHARSLDTKDHPSRSWIKNFWASIKHEIPPNMRICGENLYARHSIAYTDLPSYFMGFSVWEDDLCLDWDSTIEWFSLLGITSVPIWYRGVYQNSIIPKSLPSLTVEGYVIRNTQSFLYKDFENNIAKFVRKNHVQTDEHWMNQTVIPNTLKI